MSGINMVWTSLLSLLLLSAYGQGLWVGRYIRSQTTEETADYDLALRQKPGNKECRVTRGERLDCGFYGIKKSQCYSRGCCYSASSVESVPWCYHSKPTLLEACMSPTEERIVCGYYGIDRKTCLEAKCCWQPSTDAAAPWCYQKQRKPRFYGECGVPAIRPNAEMRIVGGDDATPHSWPWQVSLQSNGNHMCGGSLLNSEWVISAAHCKPLIPKGTDSIVLGLFDLDQSHEDYTVKRRIEKLILHKAWHRPTAENDFMLIKLNKPVRYTKAVSPICLPKRPFLELEEGIHLYTTGWGKTQLDSPASSRLQQVIVPVISPETCQQWFRESEWTYNMAIPNITDNMVCVGYAEGGRSPCHGDSGGPLIRYDMRRQRWVLMGVVSWGGRCAAAKQPAVYAKTSKAIDWIHNIIDKYT